MSRRRAPVELPWPSFADALTGLLFVFIVTTFVFARYIVSSYFVDPTIAANYKAAGGASVAGPAKDAFDSAVADPTNRYIKVEVTSPSIIAGAIPYSWDLRLSGNWTARTDEAVGGNAVVTLELRGRYDAGLGYALRSYVVNNRPTLA